MKKYLVLILVILGMTPLLNAQYPVNWTSYRYMNPGNDVTRCLAYNKTTDHVLLATRKFGIDVLILNAANGDSVGKLDVGIVTGGTYHINMVGVADDGTIYVSNLSAPQYTPGAKVKIYRYANETTAPELVFEDAPDGARYGDAFAAIGSGANKYVYISGMGNPNIVVLKDTGVATLSFERYVKLPLPGGARHGISPVSPGGKIWINGADTGFPPPQLIDYDGTVIAVVPDSLASPGGTATIKHLILGDYNLVSVSNAWALSIRLVRYFEDELGTVTFDYFGSDCDSIPLLYQGTTFINNVNATSTLDYDSRRHCMLTLFGFNSIASLSLDSLLKASTYRADALTISVDGKLDFFPTDLVGISHDREMYLTWSEGKVFAGITGHTLIDPTQQNRLYLAFDLDPNGTQGSHVPPENAAGVVALPFPADVVVMVESFTQPDYMIGKIYKWNGAAWKYTEFDGNQAAQGALAFADEGPRKLAEVALIKNAVGLGTDFTKLGLMAYVAENNPTGNVLSAFPAGNSRGNQVTFTQYFYADSLGRNMFPADPKYVQTLGPASGVGNAVETQSVPDFRLLQNYPNPFNPETSIEYTLAKSARVALEIIDVNGRLVKTLLNQTQVAGSHRVQVVADNLANGIYFYRLKIDQQPVATKKMILIK